MNTNTSDGQAEPDTLRITGILDILPLVDTFKEPESILSWVGQTKPVWMILLLITRWADKKMVDRSSPPGPPSVHELSTHTARNANVRRPKVQTELFLTPEALNLEVKITERLCLLLSNLAKARQISPTSEQVTTSVIIAPIFNIWLAIWTNGSEVESTAAWNAQANKPSPARGDVDIVVERALGSGKYIEAGVLEGKTPLSCGHDDIREYGVSEKGKLIGAQVSLS